MKIKANSLTLYKTRPARVERVGDKIEIVLEDGDSVRVRPKDVELIHPGPLDSLADLTPRPGEIETAWELLAGQTTTLAELAELAYGEFTPATAWAAWQTVEDGLYFRGEPQAVEARSAAEVAGEKAARAAKAAEEAAWTAFLERVEAGRLLPEDGRYLSDVEQVALKRHSHSRTLQALNIQETPENAHALLLELEYWDETVNPHPVRLGLPAGPPDLPLPPLPEEERLDLTHLPAFAIDDADNQDPDDALSLEGGRLWVHIADAAALIPPDSPADREARARGANLYLPEGTVAMLPEAATPRLGLGLGDVSPALSFGLDLEESGEIGGVEIRPSWVRVTRLTYAEAESRLAEEPFAGLHRLARRNEARRRLNGAIAIELPEVKVRVVGEEVRIIPLPSLKSRDIVREAMLLTGEAAGRFALERNIPFPYSSQDAPDEMPAHPAKSLSEMFALRRSLKRSQMRSSPASHAGLGMAIYSQATSPLRRYLDLVAHQQLRAYLRGESPLDEQELLARVGAADAVIGSARYAERLSNQHWTLVYLKRRPGWSGQGVLVEKRPRRNIVLIPALDLEINLHLRDDLPLDSEIPLVLNAVNLPELAAHFRVAAS